MPKAPTNPALLPGNILVEVPVTLLIPVNRLDARTEKEGRAFAEDILRSAKRKAIIYGVEIPFRIQSSDINWDTLQADKRRLDWLADPQNNIGNVQLPIGAVMESPGSLRDAIDAAMSGNYQNNMPLVEPGYSRENAE